MNWYEKRVKELGYRGCSNCKHQIDTLRTCKFMEHDDGVLHLICPRWEKRMDGKEDNILEAMKRELDMDELELQKQLLKFEGLLDDDEEDE